MLHNVLAGETMGVVHVAPTVREGIG